VRAPRILGLTVRSARDGEQALGLALWWQPDVVCLDLMLPRMSGYEVAMRISNALGERRPLLIAVTSLSRELDRQRASDAGFDGFVAKPESVDLLNEVVSGGFPLPAKAALAASTRRTGR
jgi:CheY-like chemotaxis protein